MGNAPGVYIDDPTYCAAAVKQSTGTFQNFDTVSRKRLYH